MSQTISSSQEILFSSQSSAFDDNTDSYQVSTQDILNAKSQEAIKASEFLLSLRDSQVSNAITDGSLPGEEDIKTETHWESNDIIDDNEDSIFTSDLSDSQNTDSPYKATGGHPTDTKPKVEELNVFNDLEFKPLVVVEKKKRGRKRKIRTEEELEMHLKDKKEKNRLAAQRLRQRKCSEVAKYDKEVQQYEQMVEIKKNFAQHLESKVEQLRNRIKAMTQNTINTINTINSNKAIKSEPIQPSNHQKCNSS